MSKRLCLVTEDIQFPIDEGAKKAIINLIKCMKSVASLLVVGRHIPDEVGSNYCTHRFLINRRLVKEIVDFSPDCILYFPMSSLTLGSFFRTRLLSICTHTPAIVFGFQPRQYSPIALLMVRMLKPAFVFVQSRKSFEFFKDNRFNVGLFSSGVDLQKFHPVKVSCKLKLREQYDIPKDKNIILHVGHLKSNRGLQDLLEFQDTNTTAVIVASSSTFQEPSLTKQIAESGAIVVKYYIENIEHFYQLADAYVFPTIEQDAAIEFPLSVLEALSCGIPVLTTPFGRLPDKLIEDDHIKFYRTIPEGKRKLDSLLSSKTRVIPSAYDKIADFAWEHVVKNILQIVNKTQ